MKEEFLETINQHQGIIHKVTFVYTNDPEEKKDLFQDIIYQLWKSYPKFENRSMISTWIYRIALNTALLGIRKKKANANRMETLSNQSNKNTAEIDDQAISLHMAIDSLGKIDKAIALLYLEQNNYQDIADMLGMSKSNVGVRINRIKKQLKKVLEYERA